VIGNRHVVQRDSRNSSVVSLQPLEDVWNRLDHDPGPVAFQDVLPQMVMLLTVVGPYLDEEGVGIALCKSVKQPGSGGR
jgi:hypothetical protein